MKGFNGRFLRVDLTSGEISIDEPEERYYKRYLGGRGFIIQILLAEVPKGADPLGPENTLIFALGPLTGCPLTGAGRNSVGAKSPITGGFGESEVGGFWGAELKKSGYDTIIIEGVSPKPVYIWINDSNVQIRDASEIWGLQVADTHNNIQKELGDRRVRTAVIGPAGEKLVRFASIFNDISHVAGRTGMGAVMGSKKLKAIVVKGNRLPEVSEKEKIMELSRWMNENFKGITHLWKYGTGSAIVLYEETGSLPIRNFSGGRFLAVERLTPQLMVEKSYIEKMDSCFACPIRCKKRVKIAEPWEVNPVYGGPEFETLGALGSNCGVDNLEAIIKAHELCGRYGMDTISTGGCISFAMECFEKEIITREDTDGVELNFGNAQAMVETVERIALRKGEFGNLLGEGVKRAAEKIGRGSSEFAMHVKGLEIPMFEPRYTQGMGLHYSVHVTGADHCSGIHDDLISANLSEWESIDIAESIPNTELSPRKARMLYQVGLWRQMNNYLGLCAFVPWSYKQIRDAVEFVTGWPMSYWRLMKAVERGIILARVFNIREGFSEIDDELPHRFATSPLNGPLRGVAVDTQKLRETQGIYYQMLGCNESGIPTHGRLAELDISWASKYLK